MNLHRCAALLLFAATATAQLRLPRIFRDHMVLQRDLPIAVWGWAQAGEGVSVSLEGGDALVTTLVRADDEGRWRLDLPAQRANAEGVTLTITSGAQSVQLEDVLIGEVWLCAGQSNMNRGARVEGEHPDIRLFWIDGSTAPRTEDLGADDTAGWVPATPEGVASAKPPTQGRDAGKPRHSFAEVGWVFGKRIHQELGVPVGLIQCAFGGSQVEAWTPVEGLFDEYPADARVEKPYVGHTPGLLYQSMVHGLVPFTMRGVLWYQGENNGRHKDYAETLSTWIEVWRELWGREDLPFYLVQIAPTTYAGGRMQYIWEAQSTVSQRVPHTALAPSNDIYFEGRDLSEILEDRGGGRLVLSGRASPSNPHPPNKHVVAERLATIALVDTYGRPEVTRYAPTYASHRVEGNKVLVTFSNVGEGLRLRDEGPLAWFDLAPAKAEGERKHSYHPATARIVSKDTIEVTCEAVPQPTHVRFAWDCIAIHRLRGNTGLPAIPFRTDRDDG